MFGGICFYNSPIACPSYIHNQYTYSLPPSRHSKKPIMELAAKDAFPFVPSRRNHPSLKSPKLHFYTYQHPQCLLASVFHRPTWCDVMSCKSWFAIGKNRSQVSEMKNKPAIFSGFSVNTILPNGKRPLPLRCYPLSWIQLNFIVMHPYLNIILKIEESFSIFESQNLILLFGNTEWWICC